jgi:hypothetical protein
MMDKRFADLKKIPAVPAARLLAAASIKLKTKLKSPTSADVSTVLTELAGGRMGRGDPVDVGSIAPA